MGLQKVELAVHLFTYYVPVSLSTTDPKRHCPVSLSNLNAVQRLSSSPNMEPLERHFEEQCSSDEDDDSDILYSVTYSYLKTAKDLFPCDLCL